MSADHAPAKDPAKEPGKVPIDDPLEGVLDNLLDEDADLTGPDLARAALDAARAGRARPISRRRSSLSTNGFSADGRKRGYTGAGPDARDPQPLGRLVRRLVRDRGWEEPAAQAQVLGCWEQVVGPDIAGHCQPTALSDGHLTVQAESTAWATQLRLLAPRILSILTERVGAGVVTKMTIHGPAAPSWKRGPRSIRGRGPRDTYG